MKFKNFDLDHDDLNKVIELIIETEPELFYVLFGKGKKSLPRIKKIVKAGKNSFGHDFIRLAIDKEEILGITIYYMGNQINKKFESNQFSKSIDFLGLIRIVFFEKTLINKILTKDLDEKELYIGNICVDKKFRGKGVGKFLIENIFNYAKESKCKRIILDVSKENKIAQKLYKKMGFKITKERHSSLYNTSTYQMIKEL
jgi:ribosomal protein S18 acetylase RimI-like enzyme